MDIKTLNAQKTCKNYLFIRIGKLCRERLFGKSISDSHPITINHNDCSVCADCKKPIHKLDDDAEVCIDCGGRNRRV